MGSFDKKWIRIGLFIIWGLLFYVLVTEACPKNRMKELDIVDIGFIYILGSMFFAVAIRLPPPRKPNI